MHPTWVDTVLTCPIIGDANSSRFKTLSAGFLPCQVTVPPFDINKYLERERERFSEYENILLFLNFSFSNFSIHERILCATIITVIFDK